MSHPDPSSQYQAPGAPPPGYGPAPQNPPAYGGAQPGYPAPPAQGYAAPPPAPYGGDPYASGGQGFWYDQEHELHLPNGTELASVGRRIGAFFLRIPLFIVTLGIGYIIWGAISFANGQTPVQQVLGLRTYRADDQKVAGWGWMFLSYVIGTIVDGILSAITLIISFVMFLATKRRQALHNVVGSTIVLYDPNKVLAPQK